MDATTYDHPTFPGFPAPIAMVEKESTLAKFLRLSREYGGLVPQNMLPDAMEVSRARVAQLIGAGRFRVIEIGGRNYVPAEELAHFLTLQRPTGRPTKPKAADFVRACGVKV